ncbi:hemicentin-1 isoform X6 [Hydra vulgaris]|uniref:Hemicentin-1 isoform X6 n=1 Tax=Hydra vulgaris TaxID=6087 RepID=A0ABM4CPC5_HYDVU
MEKFVLIAILRATVSVYGANQITGSDVLYVNNGATASFKWVFNFQDSDILLLSVNTESSTLPDIVRKAPNSPISVNSKNSVYASRTQVSRPAGMNGIIVDINTIGITDENLFFCKVIFLDQSADVVNKTRLIVVVAPTISVDQPKLFLTEGDNAYLKCSVIAGNPRPLLFQWFKLDSNNVEQPITIEVQANNNFDYNISQVNRESRGSYICRVKNIRGMQDSLTKILDVRYRPVVVSPPLNRSIFEQVGTEEFNCDADGNSGTTIYKWYRDKPTPENEILFPTPYILQENDGKRLKFVKPPRSIATNYYCAGKNDLGIGEAKGAYLNVTYVPGEIYIKTENGVINSNKGSNITITCQSDANPPALYQWFKYEKDLLGIVQKRLLQSSFSGDLNLYYLTTNDSADYKCFAINYPDTLDRYKEYKTEKKISLNVRYGPQQTNITVNDVLSLIPVEVIEDSKVIIKCISDSNPPAIYNIQKIPNKIQLNANGENSITFSTIKVENEGTYECISINSVMNNNEKRQVQIVVTIKPKQIDPVPGDLESSEYSTVSIKCHATGKPSPKIYWQRYGANITDDSVIQQIYNDKVFVTGYLTTIQGELKFNNIRYTDSASYSCIVYNSGGFYNQTTKVSVSYKPKITVRPGNFTRLEDGEDVKFVCEAIANPSSISWSWFFNEVEQSSSSSITQQSTSTFIRTFPKRIDNGAYRCEARNEIGTGESAIGYLVVQYPPSITEFPKNQVVNESANIVFSCKADGIPQPQISWSRASDNKFEKFVSILNINNVKAVDKDEYTCNAVNSVGVDSKKVKLLVNDKPMILTKNPSETKFGATIGMMVNLICSVSSYPIGTIVWKDKSSATLIRDGINGYSITAPVGNEFSQKSTLSVSATNELLGKEYLCQATNDYGSDEQVFSILAKGKPDMIYQLTAEDVIQPTVPVTVNITLKWIPGYGGGFPVEFILLYKESNDANFRQQYIGAAVGNVFVFTNRKTSTEYVFSMLSKNERGISDQYSPLLKFQTKDAPPPVATVRMEPDPSGTAVVIFWTITQLPSQRKPGEISNWDYGLIQYRIVDKQKDWTVNKIVEIGTNGSYKVSDLNGEEYYEFHFVLFTNSGEFGLPVDVGKLYPKAGPRAEERKAMSKNDIIAIAVGVGGTILLVLVIVLFIMIYKKRSSKITYTSSYNNGRVKVDLPTSAIKSDVVRASFAREDEDPFANDSSFLDDDKSPPPDYQDRYNAETEVVTPSYTSFGRLPKGVKQPGKYDPVSKSMVQLPGRPTEIIRGRYSMNNLEEYPEKYDDLPEPPTINPSLDDKKLNNRVPGAFGDKRLNNAGNTKYGEPPPPLPNYVTSSHSSPPSSIASSKPYHSENEYIDEAEDNYVGYLV